MQKDTPSPSALHLGSLSTPTPPPARGAQKPRRKKAEGVNPRTCPRIVPLEEAGLGRKAAEQHTCRPVGRDELRGASEYMFWLHAERINSKVNIWPELTVTDTDGLLGYKSKSELSYKFFLLLLLLQFKFKLNLNLNLKNISRPVTEVWCNNKGTIIS